MTIRANELMVGDWVYVKHYDGSVEPIKILNVYGNEVNCKTERNCFDIDEIVSGTYMIDLYPIPLTADIFEKYGFHESILRDDRWIYQDIASTKVNDSYILSSLYDDFMIGIRPHICAVHELQHALRLCGIEKEIEL